MFGISFKIIITLMRIALVHVINLIADHDSHIFSCKHLTTDNIKSVGDITYYCLKGEVIFLHVKGVYQPHLVRLYGYFFMQFSTGRVLQKRFVYHP